MRGLHVEDGLLVVGEQGRAMSCNSLIAFIADARLSALCKEPQEFSRHILTLAYSPCAYFKEIAAQTKAHLNGSVQTVDSTPTPPLS